MRAPCRVICSAMGKKSTDKGVRGLFILLIGNLPSNSLQIDRKNAMSASSSSLYPLNFLSNVPLSPRSHQLQQQRERPSLLRTVLNLTGCVMGVAGSICYEVTSYWSKVKMK